MDQFLLYRHIQDLKSVLLSLQATGEMGFEGLIGVALREITGVPFRLAGSGSQFGVDGKPTYEEDAICFEGKRYTDTVPRTEVLSKIAELPIRHPETDIWVLGATSQIGSQLVDDVRARGNKDGISVLILDWAETDLPPFAVALAMGGTRVQEFLKSNIVDDKKLREAVAALEAIRNSPDLAPHAARIQAQCNEPAVGLALAQRANHEWLNDAFSSRKQAKIKLGQPLSPGDKGMANIQPRNVLIDRLRPYLTTVTDGAVVFVLGGEGNGKSWIVAQGWLALEKKPLMIFMNPDDFAPVSGQNIVIDLLISKLIEQTGDRDKATARERWQRRLGQWRSHPATETPRLIVLVDGINQRPKSDWARIIESISHELNKLGGRLIVTARTPYFRDRVKGRLSAGFVEIDVPEWTEPERDEILAKHGIKTSDLHRDVAMSLRNPRLLGIALDLLDKADVTAFEELSVSRLLFEHIRMSERDALVPQPAQEFAHRLQKHAQELISRVKMKQEDDLKIFEDDMGAVADGRFFQEIDGDPMRYSLKEDGLTLALGFSVIDRLRTAQRNGRNLDGELDAILEPIAALDDTAAVILAALTVTTVDDRYERDIAASLVKGFAALQNPDQTQFPAFVGMAKTRPLGFMDAARTLSLAGGHQRNFDWVKGALILAGKNSLTWKEMADHVHSWLSVLSLSPERGILSHPGRDLQEEREKNRKRIEEKLQALTATERKILENLRKEDGNLNSLSHLALFLLAGKALASFAGSLLSWSFSNALNSDHAAPYNDFRHLVRLNRVDWAQTRAALLEVSASLREADVSTTGKWALVNILRATGHSDDGKEEKLLVADLTKEWHHSGSWRLIENYCATDPCDPASEVPENIANTAEKYAALNVKKLRERMGQTMDDHFFDMARTGLARFKPEVAVAKHREFATNVLHRTGISLRQGLFELHEHNALLSTKEARELIQMRTEAENAGSAGGLSEQDAWFVSFYSRLLAFPFLSAREQAEISLSQATDETILLNLMDLAKPLSEVEFEGLLKRACQEDDERRQYLLLGLARCTATPLSTNAGKHIAVLSRSKSVYVRSQALGVIAQSGNETLLEQVIDSGWSASETETRIAFEEDWYGSIVLLKAAAAGLIAHDKVLDRISPRLYGWAVTMLCGDAVRIVAHRIDSAIHRILGLEGDLVAPDIELTVHTSSSYEPNQFSINERPSDTKDNKEAMRRLSESNEAFQQRQRRNYDSFLEFEANLSKAKARIILDYLSLDEFIRMVAADEELADRWYGLFTDIDEAKLPAVHNLVLLLAHALEKKAPRKAEELYRRVMDSKPLVRFTFGKAGAQLDAMAIWGGDRSPIMDNLRFQRLDCAGNDHDLSLEVLAALSSGQQKLLGTYIEEKLRQEEPSEISRGIMVAGFSDYSEFNDKILKRYESSAGLIGSTQEAAKYAYERNVWARQWYEKMCQTDQHADFWRYAVLFTKIVDGRFEVWSDRYEQKGSSIQLFWPAVDGMLKNRFARWKEHRSKKLFGLDAPAPIFFDWANVKD